MARVERRATLTVPIDDPAVARAIEQLAAERKAPLGEMVTAALRKWLEWEEEVEDLAASAEAERDPTTPWDDMKAELRAARAARRDR